jgi:hypothetical protein
MRPPCFRLIIIVGLLSSCLRSQLSPQSHQGPRRKHKENSSSFAVLCVIFVRFVACWFTFSHRFLDALKLELIGKVTGSPVIGLHLAEFWGFFFAKVLGIATTRVEVAATGWVGRVCYFALHHNAV